MMAVFENTQAPKSYTVKLELEQDISVVSLDNGGAVFVSNDNLVIGSILAPWALDADGPPRTHLHCLAPWIATAAAFLARRADAAIPQSRQGGATQRGAAMPSRTRATKPKTHH